MKRTRINSPWDFSVLDGATFERLVHALLEAEGYEDVRHRGQRGRDGGVDLAARRGGAAIAVQCKARPRLPKSEALLELEKFLPRRAEFEVYHLVVAGTCSADEVLRALAEKIADSPAAGKLRVDLWTQSELDALTRRHRQVVESIVQREELVADHAAASRRYVHVSVGRRDRDFGAALQHDLEIALRAVTGEDWRVGWGDPRDSALPEVPAAALWCVAVTPEALADRRLAEQWRTRPWRRGGAPHLAPHLALDLAPAAWPEWLVERFARLALHRDAFAEPDLYRIDLAAIISKWIGETEKNLDDVLARLPAAGELCGPVEPAPRLPAETRDALVEWLEPVMERQALWRLLAVALGLEQRNSLDDHPSPRSRASAAVALHQGDDDPLIAARRLVGVVRDELAGEESAARLASLDALEEEIAGLERRSPPADERGILAAWLAKLRRDHDRLVDYFQRRQELDMLDKVHVELELAPSERLAGGAAPAAEAVEKIVPGAPMSVRELLELDPREHPWVTRRFTILGDPGSGKTTLLRHLAAELAAAWRPGRRVPVFQSLPALVRSKQPLLERLEESLRAAAGLDGLATVLDHEGRAGRLLLLLDGFDEVGPEHRADAENRLRGLAERWPEMTLIVTSRPIGYRRFANDFRELRLLPLDRERQLEFLALWLGRAAGRRDEAEASAALARLAAADLEGLTGNPLYLTLMAMLLERGESPKRNRPQLYVQVFDLLLSGEHKYGEVEPIERRPLVRRVLRALALSMSADNLDREPREDLVERFYRDDELAELRGEIRGVRRWDGPVELFLDDVAEKTGILGPHDGPEAEYSFWHRTFREALAAQALAEKERGEILAHATSLAGQESRWAEPYALLAGQVKDADALVRSLVEANRALGLRALATAQGVSEETLDEILQLTGDWEERSKVYEEIPEQLGDPERALRMIDRLRRRTRDGNDLFFLDRAAFLVGEKWESAAEPARDLQRRLYDHIELADEARPLLLRFQDREGEEKDLWREIPEGIGWVGSPESEAGRDDDEGPRHRVEIVRPFWLAAVPVTHAQYALFDPGKPFRQWDGVAEEELPDHPRVGVTWYEAVSFCRWLAAVAGLRGARLPAEEEWEYACRAGSATAYWSGDSEADLERVGWYGEGLGGRTHRVAGKEPNPWGLYDVHGNVWEWCSTAWDEKAYAGRSSEEPMKIDPADPAADLAEQPRARRVIRGGSYWDPAQDARSAFRLHRLPGFEIVGRGFRVLLPRPPSDR